MGGFTWGWQIAKTLPGKTNPTLKTFTLLLFPEGLTLTPCGKKYEGCGVVQAEERRGRLDLSSFTPRREQGECLEHSAGAPSLPIPLLSQQGPAQISSSLLQHWM